jgi:RimJ/RimL family protein N-acetyltransferase
VSGPGEPITAGAVPGVTERRWRRERAQRDAGPGGQVAVRRFPSLTVATPRLHVRPLDAGDARAVSEIFVDRQTQRWLPFPPGFGLSDGLAWCTGMAEERRDSGTGDHYGVVRREDDRLVGCLWTKRTDWGGRVTEVSYAVAPEARGFGVAAEAVVALTIALVLEHGFQRVELRVTPGNTASRRVAEKAGFTYEGLLRNAGYVHSGRVDLEVWSFVAADLR